MRREMTSALIILFVGATYWAYTVADSLLREFSGKITFVDLGVLFILGLIAGVALGQLVPLRRG
jgi:hypothetical protein